MVAIAEKTVSIAYEQSLPMFRPGDVQEWFDVRGSRVPKAEAERKAVLFADTYTNYSHPKVGKATVSVLEATGVRLDVAEWTDSGRPCRRGSWTGLERRCP